MPAVCQVLSLNSIQFSFKNFIPLLIHTVTKQLYKISSHKFKSLMSKCGANTIWDDMKKKPWDEPDAKRHQSQTQNGIAPSAGPPASTCMTDPHLSGSCSSRKPGNKLFQCHPFTNFSLGWHKGTTCRSWGDSRQRANPHPQMSTPGTADSVLLASCWIISELLSSLQGSPAGFSKADLWITSWVSPVYSTWMWMPHIVCPFRNI